MGRMLAGQTPCVVSGSEDEVFRPSAAWQRRVRDRPSSRAASSALAKVRGPGRGITSRATLPNGLENVPNRSCPGREFPYPHNSRRADRGCAFSRREIGSMRTASYLGFTPFKVSTPSMGFHTRSELTQAAIGNGSYAAGPASAPPSPHPTTGVASAVTSSADEPRCGPATFTWASQPRARQPVGQKRFRVGGHAGIGSRIFRFMPKANALGPPKVCLKLIGQGLH